MGLMPSYMGGLEAVGVKVVAAFPANFGTEYDTHQEVVLFFDTERGLLRANVDATAITAIRTEDLASGHRVYEVCKERGLGTWVEIGGAPFGAAVEESG